MNDRARIILISHAPTSAVRRAAFPCDEPIEEIARARIRGGNWHADRAQCIYCGPEKRTQETATILGLSATVDPALRDCDYGAWAGHDLNELEREHPEDVALWLSAPDAAPHCGESIRDLIMRMASWLTGQTKSACAIAVTHPAVIRAVILSVLGAPPQAFWRIDIAPLTLTDIRFNGGSWTLRCAGASLP